MNCYQPKSELKGKSETKQIKIQLPLYLGDYPSEPPTIVHNTQGFFISPIDYTEETGLVKFDLLPSETVFSAPVRFILGAKYPDGSTATWRDFMQVTVLDDSDYIYTAPTLFKLNIENSLLFDAFGNFNVEYKPVAPSSLMVEAYATLAIFKQLLANSNFILMANATLNITKALSSYVDMKLEAFAGISANRGLLGSASLNLEAFASFEVSPVFEAPVTSAMLSKYELAFGFDRLKNGYIGNTVRLINIDTSAQQDFTFKPNGLFDNYSALTFASNSNIVKFYAMDASGRELLPTGTIPFARSGVIQRQQIEASFRGANAGFIIEDNTKGVVGCDIDGAGTNFLACTNANIPSNCEITTLWSHKTRKQANDTLLNTVAEPSEWGGTVNTEAIVSIGTAGSSTNFITLTTNRSSGASLFLRRVATNVSTSSLPRLTQPIKQWCANIATMAMTDTKTSLWYGGDRMGNVEGTTGSTVDSATGDTTGGSTAGDSAVTRQLLRIGRQINGPTGETTSNASMIFSGIIITDPLTARERLTLHANWTAMCQAHIYQPTSYAHNLMQDYVLFGKATSGASNLAGEKGLFNIAFNTTTYASEVPTWGYANVSNSGLKGLSNTLTASRANQFEDVGATKVGGQDRELTTVSVIQWSPVVAVGSNLTDFYAYGSGTALRPYGTQMTGLDMQVAKDHNCFAWNTLAQNGKDPNGLTDRVGPSYTNIGGTTTALYNGDNHPFFYRKKTLTRLITAESSALYDNMTQTQAKAWMATQDEPQHSTQGSFGATLLPRIGRTYVIITRIKPNASFVETGSQSEIDAFLRKATKSIVVVPLNAPCLATYDGFYAEEATQGATRVPNTGSRLVAHGDDYDQLTGHRLMFGVIQRAITDAEIPKLVTSVRSLVNAV